MERTMQLTPELEAMVRSILQHPEGHPWTIMGFGMVRCDIDGRDFRLNIWDRRFQTNKVSTIHDHPWNLESLVLSGCVENVIYETISRAHSSEQKHWGVIIEPGPVGGQMSDPRPWKLEEVGRTRYTKGEGYAQGRREVHESLYVTGTVTLIRRTDRDTESERGDTAHVYWPEEFGEEWVDATPQKATMKKVRKACEVALARWDEENPK